jgi:leucyl/phenylalanyl-tRNA---protein transferase
MTGAATIAYHGTVHGNVAFLAPGVPLPEPLAAGSDGLVAIGGDLGPDRLLEAYGKGIFPWYHEQPILWFSPDPRCVLPPGEIRVNRALRRALRRARFEVLLDTAFEQVIRACAEAPRPAGPGTWITTEMIEAYVRLHRLGFAHSAEAWRDGRLLGGLYGVALGRIFFGESMFTQDDDASKVAFVRLAAQLHRWGFSVIDCQVRTEVMMRLGAREWSRGRFLAALREALAWPTRRGCWTLHPGEAAPPEDLAS